MPNRIRVGIVGGAGYTAGELIRILLYHPAVELKYIQSSSNNGLSVSSVHSDLLGDTDLVFTDINFEDTDVVFLCSGHGKSIDFLNNTVIPKHVKIIDMSHDFRLKRAGNDFVYGLPELNREEIRVATKIANPGCFATAIQLALIPLAANGLLTDEVHINAITGSTGAGQAPTDTSHFSWRDNNLSVYKAFEHQHLGEICQSLCQAQPGFSKDVNFIPVRGNYTRGIFVTAYTKFIGTIEEANDIYTKFYASHPFVNIARENPDMKQVVNTNKGLLFLEKHGNKLMIISCIDNLLKGASGQAVQNMNLMFGLDERCGLNLKAIGF
ncbi:MAG: N-acetyl-gamma-glutamyl-phosphate reductase [Bacteroidia bacterium]|nr:N-acetyl-gamma-glutamyl-phosphate reductase [Bacteroidia bacterium]